MTVWVAAVGVETPAIRWTIELACVVGVNSMQREGQIETGFI